MLPKDKDGQENWEHSKHCAPCHLHVDSFLHIELLVVPNSLLCFICGEKNNAYYYAIVLSMQMWVV